MNDVGDIFSYLQLSKISNSSTMVILNDLMRNQINVDVYHISNQSVFKAGKRKSASEIGRIELSQIVFLIFLNQKLKGISDKILCNIPVRMIGDKVFTVSDIIGYDRIVRGFHSDVLLKLFNRKLFIGKSNIGHKIQNYLGANPPGSKPSILWIEKLYSAINDPNEFLSKGDKTVGSVSQKLLKNMNS